MHSAPSLRYIVHLEAPGLSVIGAGEPALPGISIGHNDRIAFGLTIFNVNQDDLLFYDLAEVRKSIAVAQYERAIQSVFREVSDGIAGRETFGLQLGAQRKGLAAAERRAELSQLRYRAGVDSRLELLDAQRSDYAARLALLELRRQELSNAAGLYRALGGGDEPRVDMNTNGSTPVR